MPSACVTRWWSELRQIEFVDEQQQAIMDFLNDFSNGKHQNLLLEHSELRMLKAIMPLLKKLEAFEEQMSSESEVTGSVILRAKDEINIHLKASIGIITEKGVVELRSHLRQMSSDLDAIYSTTEKSHLDMANYFDIRLERINSNQMEPIVREEAKKLKCDIANPIVPPKRKKFSIGNLFTEPNDEEADELREHNALEEELSRYRCEAKIRYDSDILEWWSQRRGVYPLLACIAKKYLCITATSVPSERVFSVGGAVLTRARKTMTDQHAEELIFLCKNRKQLPFW